MSTPDAPMHVLFSPEHYAERAVCAWLNEQGLPARQRHELDELPIPRIEVRMTTGEARAHLRTWDGIAMRDSWDCTLAIDIVTKRDPEQPEAHIQTAGQVRYELRRWPRIFDATGSPFHEVPTLIESSAEQSVNIEEDTNVTSFVFSGVVGIRG